MVGVVRVAGGAVGAGVAGPGEGEVVQVESGHDLGASVQQPRYEGGVRVGRIPLQDQRGTGHGHARDADVVLEAETFARQLPRGRSLECAFPHDGVEWVLGPGGFVPRVTVPVLERCRRQWDAVEDLEVREQPGQQVLELLQLVVGQLEVVVLREPY